MPLDPSNMMTRSATSMSLEGPSSLVAIDPEELHRRREVLTASDAQARAVHYIAAATERASASSGHPFLSASDADLPAPAADILPSGGYGNPFSGRITTSRIFFSLLASALLPKRSLHT